MVHVSLFSCDLRLLNEESLEDIWELYLVGVKRPPLCHYQSGCGFSIPYSSCQLSELDTREKLLYHMDFIINPNPRHLIVGQSGYWIILLILFVMPIIKLISVIFPINCISICQTLLMVNPFSVF